MKLLENACYILGIVIALGMVTQVCTKPVDDVQGAIPQCNVIPAVMSCSSVHEEREVNGQTKQVQVQPNCQGDYNSLQQSGTPKTVARDSNNYDWGCESDPDDCVSSQKVYNDTTPCSPE
jgi:hypothetical protein